MWFTLFPERTTIETSAGAAYFTVDGELLFMTYFWGVGSPVLGQNMPPPPFQNWMNTIHVNKRSHSDPL
jgi:hypothetical protein